MKLKNLLVLCNTFPDENNTFVGGIFVKEQIKYLKNYFENVYVISPVAYGMEYLRKVHLEKYTFDNFHVYFPKYFNLPFFYFHFRDYWVNLEYSCIYNLIQKENLQFDLIHAHYTWPSGAVATKLKINFDVPLIITEHTSETFLKAIKNKDSQYIRTWEITDSIIRVRSGDISSFQNVGIPLDKVNFIPNGYDSNKFFPKDMTTCRKKLGLPTDKKIILNVGNLYSTIKGHEYLIRAMSEIVNQRKDSLCVIVGKGKLQKSLENLIDELGMKNYIKLVGGKTHDEIPLWINACDLFVLPSLNEGNPTIMFECLGCGKPFVGTKVGGIPEIIISNDYGLLVEPRNSKELAKTILFALNQKWDYEKIKNYSTQYTWKNISNSIFNVYLTCMYNQH